MRHPKDSTQVRSNLFHPASPQVGTSLIPKPGTKVRDRTSPSRQEVLVAPKALEAQIQGPLAPALWPLSRIAPKEVWQTVHTSMRRTWEEHTKYKKEPGPPQHGVYMDGYILFHQEHIFLRQSISTMMLESNRMLEIGHQTRFFGEPPDPCDWLHRLGRGVLSGVDTAQKGLLVNPEWKETSMHVSTGKKHLYTCKTHVLFYNYLCYISLNCFFWFLCLFTCQNPHKSDHGLIRVHHRHHRFGPRH